jgi:putative transposase
VSELRQQEAEMNAALSAAMPAGMPRGGLEVAIDTHDEPFYGKTPELRACTCKTRAKDGTTHFFRIASAYVIWREVRLTLALTYVLPDDPLPVVVEKLLKQLKQVGLHATVLYLDKGFCSGDIIRYLQHTRQAAVLACPVRGKQGGIRALCSGRGSFTTDYTFTDGTTARLALVDTRVRDPKTQCKQRKWLAFVLVHLDWSARQVYTKYRRRFGIEASYRLLRQVKVLTNSRNPALRFFLLGLGLLMQNVWVLARWLFTRRPGKGRHKLIPSLLRFDRFCKLLVRAVERFYPPPLAMSVFVSPQSVIH